MANTVRFVPNHVKPRGARCTVFCVMCLRAMTNLRNQSERLRRAREAAGFTTAADASRRFEWNLNTYKSHENGVRQFGATLGKRYARAFKVRAEWLLGLGGPMREGHEGIDVVGEVGAGSRVYPIDDGALERVVPPFSTPSDAIAFVVRGDSMEPAFSSGSYVIARPIDDPQEALFRRAVVTLEDGSRFVKQLLPGSSPGTFTLVSHNAQPITNVKVIAAARVLGFVEPNQ